MQVYFAAKRALGAVTKLLYSEFDWLGNRFWLHISEFDTDGRYTR